MLPSIFSSILRLRIWRWALLTLVMVGVVAFLMAGCSSPAGSSSTPVANPTASSTGASNPVSFSKDVQPILQSRCVNCHGGQQISRGLNMTSYSNLMAGSVNGPVVVPGDPTHSLLIQMVQQGKMPKNGPMLLPKQIEILSEWIQAGAPNN